MHYQRPIKKEIHDALSPFIKSESDVLGKEDLNDLLATHSDIEKRYYKLWIGTTTALIHVINKPIFDRSAFTLEEITSKIRLYVPTINHEEAKAKLESLGSVIITGQAGIGKTTLSEQLVLYYVAEGFSLVQIAEDISEGERVYDAASKQIFYFDDFLGRNYLEGLSGHEGTHIVNLIRRITKDKNKRFILTSRSTILNQGKLLSDVFINNNLSRNEFEIALDSLTEFDRARILYNHIVHSSIGEDAASRISRTSSSML